MTKIAALPDRGVIAVEGPDRVGFLQGLVSNDVALAEPGRAIWAALLTPQGKYVADFFVVADADRLLLECEAALVPMLVQRLGRYRLRAAVTLRADPSLSVCAGWDGAGPPSGQSGECIVFPDPRLPEAGWRGVSAALPSLNASPAEYDAHRLALGLPNGTRDLEPDKTVLLEAGFDELNGISWTKGCYMGQELTARTRYRGLLKRRLVPVRITGTAPEAGTVIHHDSKDVGTMRSSANGLGLAVLRLDALSAPRLSCGAAALTPIVPVWMRLPERVS